MRRSRVRDPIATRQAILTAARTVLAQSGSEGLSVSRVAHLAGVNRGTAYQHFQTREQLLAATAEWVGVQLNQAVYGDVDDDTKSLPPKRQPILRVIQHLVEFAVENPELARIWLLDVLSSDHPSKDPFFRRLRDDTEALASSSLSQDGIDVEALSVMMLAGYFLWPVWVRSHARTKTERKRLATRYSDEVIRLMLHGVLRPEYYPQLEKQLEEESAATKA